ncbi:unnamed protein product [Dibothriocephalus latus]|uniref:Uncharacterized protein n=1 Tax=Dibothriocephalus latus TaxID=60516 RepID=A0A3P6QLW1_DIBLA|nr:unnamed protein product [Dibothriocephalus latus]
MLSDAEALSCAIYGFVRRIPLNLSTDQYALLPSFKLQPNSTRLGPKERKTGQTSASGPTPKTRMSFNLFKYINRSRKDEKEPQHNKNHTVAPKKIRVKKRKEAQVPVCDQKSVMEGIMTVLNSTQIEFTHIASNRVQCTWRVPMTLQETDIDSDVMPAPPELLALDLEVIFDEHTGPQSIKFKRLSGSIEDFRRESRKLLDRFHVAWGW